MTYIMFTLLHNLLDFQQVNLFKRAKYWDSFFTHCTLAVAAISMFSRYSFLLHWYCSPIASPSSLGHARPLCFPITVMVSHARTASLLVPFSILSCMHESVLVQFLQTLFIPSHYLTALQS